MPSFKTLEKEKRRESAGACAGACAPCVSLCFADGGGGCFTPGKTLMLLTATNSVKCRLIQPLRTSFQDVPVVRASGLRLCTFFFNLWPLKQFICIHFLHLDSCYMSVGEQSRRLWNCIRGSQNNRLPNCLSLGPVRLCAGAVHFLFCRQACLLVMCFVLFYPVSPPNLGLCFSQDHPLSPSVEHFGDMNKISTEK